jgi:transcriptional regulator with XRE-family HTH domain
MSIAARRLPALTGGTAPSARHDLSQILVTGPFPDALRATISASRLSLDRIQHRLALRGVTISVATLSYWQSGRRRPERPESLEALRQLEAVLGLPQTALSSLLGPPRPRGRRSHAADLLPIDALWSRREHLASLLSKVDTSFDGQLGRISQQDRCEIGPDRGHRSLWVRQILRAENDGPDRWILVYDSETPGVLPELTGLRNCGLGRTTTDDDGRIFVAELLFERPLARGDTLIMEYELVNPGPPYPGGGDVYCRKFRLPAREYVLEVRFSPDALPTRCQQFSTVVGEDERSRRRNLVLDSSGGVHAVALGFGPGVFGIGWEWPDRGPRQSTNVSVQS